MKTLASVITVCSLLFLAVPIHTSAGGGYEGGSIYNYEPPEQIEDYWEQNRDFPEYQSDRYHSDSPVRRYERMELNNRFDRRYLAPFRYEEPELAPFRYTEPELAPFRYTEPDLAPWRYTEPYLEPWRCGIWTYDVYCRYSY